MWSLLAHSHSLFSLFFFFSLIFSFFIFTHIFFSLFFFFSSFFSSLFFFFSFQQGRTSTILGTEWPVAGAHRSPPHLDFCALWHQKPSVWCRYLQVYSTNWRNQVCSWCSSHVLMLRMPLILKMVSDKVYPRVHRNRQHALAFICLVEERFFFVRVWAISRQCLFMVTSLTMGVFLLQPW